jgi:hypothetical protein
MTDIEASGGPAEDLITRDLLLGSVAESAIWYTTVAENLNEDRSSGEDEIEIVPAAALTGLAHGWLTDERLAAVREALSYTPEKPPVIMPVPNTPVTAGEIVTAWANTRDRGLLVPAYRALSYLADGRWRDRSLSGYDPKQADDPVRFVAIETSDAEEREGSMTAQREALKIAREAHPSVRTATIFEGAILANRFLASAAEVNWKETTVRAINLRRTGYRDSVPAANICEGGVYSYVGFAPEHDAQASRRAVA